MKSYRGAYGWWLVGLGSAVLVWAVPLGARGQQPSTTRELKQEAQQTSTEIRQGPVQARQQARKGAELAAGQPARDTQREPQQQTGPREPITDAWLTTKTKLALLADEEVSGTGINVDTSNRVVTLKGTVSSEAERQKALQIARSIEGVVEVRDQLTVGTAEAGAPQSGAQPVAPGPVGTTGTAGADQRDDEQIAREVRQAIQEKWGRGRLTLDGDTLKGPQDTEIEVSVDNGVVTLEGKVPTAEDLLTAAQAARSVPGVRAVKTNMESGRLS